MTRELRIDNEVFDWKEFEDYFTWPHGMRVYVNGFVRCDFFKDGFYVEDFDEKHECYELMPERCRAIIFAHKAMRDEWHRAPEPLEVPDILTSRDWMPVLVLAFAIWAFVMAFK